MPTYLANEGREILMLEKNWEDFFGEAIFVKNVESSARICPCKHCFKILALYYALI